jgi:hypothetical protein
MKCETLCIQIPIEGTVDVGTEQSKEIADLPITIDPDMFVCETISGVEVEWRLAGHRERVTYHTHTHTRT